VSYASTDRAIDFTWNWRLTKDGQLMLTAYRAFYSQCVSAGVANRCMGQWDTYYHAIGNNGYEKLTWDEMLYRYYVGSLLTPVWDPPGGFSLRYYGNGYGGLDRVSIRLDAPARPVDVGDTDFTLEWWMKARDADNDSTAAQCGANDGWIYGNTLIDRDVFGPGDLGDYGVSLSDGRLAFGASVGASGTTACGSTAVADGDWHHIAVTRRVSDGRLQIFVDGVLDGEADGPDGDLRYTDGRTTSYPKDPFLVLGAEKHDAGSEFPSYNGLIDELRVSNVLRYDANFSAPTGPFSTDSNTVGLYHFDEGFGDTLNDDSSAAGGPSQGGRSYGGVTNGPEWTDDSPWFVPQPTPTPYATPTRTATASRTPTPTRTPTFTRTATATASSTRTATSTRTPTATAEPTTITVFAVIGDYGSASAAEQDVATLVASWNPEFILTTGDNNYPDGSAATIDDNVGQFYSSFISPYTGSYGSGAGTNRFFPSLGNHDWVTPGADPFRAYFALPGNERYFNFTWGPVEFFAVDSDPNEPDGVGATSAQATWLQAGLAASRAPWQIVYFHHAPYSSGATHGSTTGMRWPFAAWGADAVVTGHDHVFERLQVDGIPFFVNGLGGHSIYNFGAPLSGSQIRYNTDYGAMRVEATRDWLRFQFIARDGSTVDDLTINRAPVFGDVPATHWASGYIETLYFAGFVSGCQATPTRLYCPNSILSRAESAVFVERGQHGAIPNPPYPSPGTSTFADVARTFWGFGWIESLWTDGFTAGCQTSPRLFCPNSQHTRAEGSVFFLRIKNGAAYQPPAPTGIFTDVALTDWYAGWVEDAFNQGLLPECQASPLRICPNSPLDRSWAAYMMVQAKGIRIP
jgi:hypothetical protein